MTIRTIPRAAGKLLLCASLTLAAAAFAPALAPALSPALAQDIHPAPSGAVQAVRPGAIGRIAGSQRSGTGAFATSESDARAVSGKVAGYGARQRLGGLPEYASQASTSFGSHGDFPTSDFVATMPRPVFGSPVAPAPANTTHPGPRSVPPPAHRRARARRAPANPLLQSLQH